MGRDWCEPKFERKRECDEKRKGYEEVSRAEAKTR